MNLKLDSSGDIAIENNELVFVEGSQEIQQLVSQRLSTFMGEWFLDITIGLPYYQHILVKQVNPTVVNAVIVREIITTDGFKELTFFQMDYDESTRTLDVEFEGYVEDDPNLIEFKVNLGG